MRLSLATRIFVGYAVVLVTFAVVSVFSVAELRRSQVESRLDGEGYLTLAQMASAMAAAQKNQADDALRLREEANAPARRALVRLSRLYFPGFLDEKLTAGLSTVDRIDEFAPDSERAFIADLRTRFAELQARSKEYEQQADRLFSSLEQAESNSTTVAESFERARAAENVLSSSIRLLQGALEVRIRDRVVASQVRERRSGVVIIALSISAIAVGLLATFLAARSLRPIRLLTDGVSRVSRGDYSAQYRLSGDDEIAVLAREFDAMASALREREALVESQQEALVRAERLAAVGRISAQIAHEVRNPLSSIGLNVEMLSDQLDSKFFSSAQAAHEAQELLGSVTREIDRLTAVTDEYLTLARLPQPAIKRESLDELVDATLQFARAELGKSKIEVQHETDGAAHAVMVDRSQLRQVFLNLLKNSREAMPQGGALTVSVRNAASRVELRWSDTGTGIPPEASGQVFEPFYTTKRGGTGLGLSLSRQILEQHGATIALEAKDTPGTTFVLSFTAV
jgi:two-component system, NtrC family, sensor kinase